MNHSQARVQFADWLKTNHPDIFQRAIAFAENSTNAENGLGAHGEPVTSARNGSEGGSFWDKFTTAAMGIGTTALALKNQRDAMKINLERAKAGQPPIDIATSAPVIRTQIDMSPQLQQRLMSRVGEGLNKTLLFAGLGVLAFFAFKKFA